MVIAVCSACVLRSPGQIGAGNLTQRCPRLLTSSVRSDDSALSSQGSSRLYVIRGPVGDPYLPGLEILSAFHPRCSRNRYGRPWVIATMGPRPAEQTLNLSSVG